MAPKIGRLTDGGLWANVAGWDTSIPRLLKRELIHELGADLQGAAIEESILVPPSRHPTQVQIKSVVVTQAAQKTQSPAYLAAIRRRHAKALAQKVIALREHAGRSDFSVYTFPVCQMVQEVLRALETAREEGNTRLILRQVRDTLRNGGWENYRREEVSASVARLLQDHLLGEEVLPRDADAAFDKLFDLGLDPVGAPLPILARPGGTTDEQEEAQVPDRDLGDPPGAGDHDTGVRPPHSD